MADDTEFIAAKNASEDGEFVRDATYINDRVVADLPAGSDPVGEKIGEMRWPVEAGRYRLMAARACPWASRSIIVRRLMGLEGAISMGLAGPTHDVNSWVFDLDPDGKDPVTGMHRLQEA
ncbi:MAG: glutathione S-transferase family protein, partial [Dietzia cercidiphylli]